MTTVVEESKPKPGGFWSGWTAFAAGATGLLTALGALVGGLAAAGVIGGGGGDGGAQPTTTPSTTAPSTFVTFNPTPEEQRLLRVVPEDLQPTCERPAEDDHALPAAVSVFCYDPALVRGFVRFALFDSRALLDKYMNERRNLGDESKRCGSGPSGSAIYRGADGQPMGRLVCYVDDVGAWLEWTNIEALVYGVAHMPDGDWETLHDSWARFGTIRP